RRLQKEYPGVFTDMALPGFRCMYVRIGGGDSPAWKDFVQNLVGGAEQGAGSENMVTLLQKSSQGGEDCSHAGGGRDSRFGFLQPADLVDEFLGIGIGIAAVDIPLLLAGEQGTCLFRGIEEITGSKEQGRGVFPLGCDIDPGADRIG